MPVYQKAILNPQTLCGFKKENKVISLSAVDFVVSNRWREFPVLQGNYEYYNINTK